MSTSASTTLDEPVIDLRAFDDEQQAEEAYRPERIIDWLRTSGGSLGERAMKCAAADLVEEAMAPGVGATP